MFLFGRHHPRRKTRLHEALLLATGHVRREGQDNTDEERQRKESDKADAQRERAWLKEDGYRGRSRRWIFGQPPVRKALSECGGAFMRSLFGDFTPMSQHVAGSSRHEEQHLQINITVFCGGRTNMLHESEQEALRDGSFSELLIQAQPDVMDQKSP